MTQLRLITNDDKIIDRTGSSGIMVTTTRQGSDVHVQVDIDTIAAEELQSGIAILLAEIEARCGKPFMVGCLAHYAEETEKTFPLTANSVAKIRGRHGPHPGRNY